MTNPKMTTVASYDVKFLQFLNESSKPTQAFPEFADSKTLLSI